VEKEKERLAAIAAKVGEMQKFSQEVQNAINSVASISEKNRLNVEKVNSNTQDVGLRIQELSGLARALAAADGA
jgi:methyl-accepting chemotaxis protein